MNTHTQIPVGSWSFTSPDSGRTYVLTVTERTVECSCPGFRRWFKCKHVSGVKGETVSRILSLASSKIDSKQHAVSTMRHTYEENTMKKSTVVAAVSNSNKKGSTMTKTATVPKSASPKTAKTKVNAKHAGYETIAAMASAAPKKRASKKTPLLPAKVTKTTAAAMHDATVIGERQYDKTVAAKKVAAKSDTKVTKVAKVAPVTKVAKTKIAKKIILPFPTGVRVNVKVVGERLMVKDVVLVAHADRADVVLMRTGRRGRPAMVPVSNIVKVRAL